MTHSKSEEMIIKNSINFARKHAISVKKTGIQRTNEFKKMMERLLKRIEEEDYED